MEISIDKELYKSISVNKNLILHRVNTTNTCTHSVITANQSNNRMYQMFGARPKLPLETITWELEKEGGAPGNGNIVSFFFYVLCSSIMSVCPYYKGSDKPDLLTGLRLRPT